MAAEGVNSLLGGLATVVNKTPVPFTGRIALPGLAVGGGSDPTAQMRAMGSVSTLFAIVHRLSNATAQVNWRLYRSAASGREEDRTEVTTHFALTVLNKPNQFFTRGELIESTQQHLDLTGEGWWLVARDERARALPVELWPVRPDRISPVPHPTEFLTGYLYRGPDGESIPLQLDEVIQLRMPNPLDPYRGMGPVQTLLADLDATRYSAEWNRNFFLNSAEPGGVIEFEDKLTDEEFAELTTRWREQHQGVAAAHRVAIIEKGKWIDRKYSMRDMQFAELRGIAREIIREGFGFPKAMLGTVDDVNRANAEANEVVFGRWLLIPRLERIKQALNNDFLPLFGSTGKGVEFDYDNPVPDDREADNAELTARANAAKALVESGYSPQGVLSAVGLPDIAYGGAPAPPAALSGPTEPTPGPTARVADARAGRPARSPSPVRGADGPPDMTKAMAAVQRSHDKALTALVAAWGPIRDTQIAALIAQIIALVNSGDTDQLPNITAPTDQAHEALTNASADLGAEAARQVADEADDQGVTVTPIPPPRHDLAKAAAVTVGLLATGLAASAAGEAIRRAASGVSGEDVADGVAQALNALSDASLRTQLGAALHRAQHAGRMATLRSAPEAAYYGSEINDANTCDLCAEVDGRWLGNSVAEAEAEYPTGGYIRCEGRDRCRGQVVAVWRPRQVEET